jgi:polar amino acid transport system substrate-binding protein
VSARDVDAAVDDSPIASWFARTGQDLAVVSMVPDSDAQYALMLARGNTPLRRRVDRALARVRRNGSYAAIYARWMADLAEPRRS